MTNGYQRFPFVEDAFDLPQVNLCNCVGPAPGEKLCKCQLEMDRIKQDDLRKFNDWVLGLREWPSQKN